VEQQPVKLIDASGALVAVAEVADEGGYYGGTIDLRATPPEIRALFEEFDECVNGQMFSFLDSIEDKIAALDIRAVLENGCEVRVKDLQVHPSTGDVTFKLAGVAPAQPNVQPPRVSGVDDDRQPGVEFGRRDESVM
jgi:hypothetical protein